MPCGRCPHRPEALILVLPLAGPHHSVWPGTGSAALAGACEHPLSGCVKTARKAWPLSVTG